MTPKPKRTRSQRSESLSSDLLSSESSDSTAADFNADSVHVIPVTFDYQNVETGDFHGLKSLLGQVFDSQVNTSDLADSVINLSKQFGIGSVIRCINEDDDSTGDRESSGDDHEDSADDHEDSDEDSASDHEDSSSGNDVNLSVTKQDCSVSLENSETSVSDPYAVISLVEISNDSYGFIKYLHGICPQEMHSELHKLQTEKLYLLLNTRLINMPPHVAPGLFRLLVEEIFTSNSYNSNSTVFYCTRTYQEVQLRKPGQKSKKQGKQSKTSNNTLEYHYYNAEDEIIQRFAFLKFNFVPASTRTPAAMRVFQDAGLQESREMMAFKLGDLPQMAAQIQTFIGE